MGAARRRATLHAPAQPSGQNLFKAVAINIFNPNPYLFWSIVGGPILLQGMRQSMGSGLSFVAGFYGVFMCGLMILIGVFATVGRLDPLLNRILIIVSALGMGAIGVYQIVVSLGALAGW